MKSKHQTVTPPIATARRDELLVALGDAATSLSDDSLRTLVLIAGRLEKGQREYGLLHLETDQRDYRQEATEELLDACVYLTFKLLKDRHG